MIKHVSEPVRRYKSATVSSITKEMYYIVTMTDGKAGQRATLDRDFHIEPHIYPNLLEGRARVRNLLVGV